MRMATRKVQWDSFRNHIWAKSQLQPHLSSGPDTGVPWRKDQMYRCHKLRESVGIAVAGISARLGGGYTGLDAGGGLERKPVAYLYATAANQPCRVFTFSPSVTT
jgi:hypothetical protein